MTVDRYFAVDGDEREDYLGSLFPDELLHLGIDLYNAGHYWNAHEAWEEVWLESERGLRGFYQGLIQVSAAFVHVTRNRYPGGVKLLTEGISKLERYPPHYMGLDLAAFAEGARAARERLLALGEARIAEFQRELIPRITTVPRDHDEFLRPPAGRS
jgi:predicted metal-dependent hydrolase